MYTVLEGCVMAKKKRVMLVLTDEMHEALNRQAARRGATLSGLVRSVLGEWLTEQGDPVDWVLAWGGYRERPEDKLDE